ncbi:bis-aminopropyl spermidine synthase family protein [uncultured Clostridium sp.]|uniref:bis-aminopropyl spermidine synthase family protein n=1 Tax=uncultured Clostridium sp. TaxID=59620 RepID=UPI0028E29622|nr:bis-aminopropyl spermidine synthase family protein [uncultured Clostridium sp.]
MNNYLQIVSESVNIEDGEESIKNILIDIYFKDGISTKELARKNLLPIPVVAAIKKEFIKQGVLIQNRGVRLTERGRNFIGNQLGFLGLNKELYMKLLEEPWKEHKEIREIKEVLGEIFINRPEVDVTIDQSKCTVDTAVKRAVLCLRNSALIGKNILCLGDDDLVSIALGFLLKKLFADIKHCKTRIIVMDIDRRIMDYINKVAKEEDLPVQCEYIDFKLPLPEKFKKKFDCLFTDPPYTLQGMELFLSRGVEALKNERGRTIFLSYGHKSPEFELNMQKIFVDMGLTVLDILNGFNAYDGAGIIGGIGQMIVLKTTSRTKVSIGTSYEGKIYTGELKVTVRSYKCRGCGEIIKVGDLKEFKTIEELKAKGCRKCNNRIFNLIQKEMNKDGGAIGL